MVLQTLSSQLLSFPMSFSARVRRFVICFSCADARFIWHISYGILTRAAEPATNMI
jgi:hypothetical protein